MTAVRKGSWIGIGLVLTGAVSGCEQAHGASGIAARALVTAADRFFDVKPVKDATFVAVGYHGRILRTEDAGARWQEVQSPIKSALLRLCFVDAEYGWTIGHQGVILHTQDGGKSWQVQKSGTTVALFAVDFVDRLHGFAVGDSSTLLRSQDGGQTWEVKPVPLSLTGIREDMTLAISDTIYYGMDFTDARTGWIVGEYGNIRHTTDAGDTWDSLHGSLLTGGIRDAMDLPAFFDVRIDGDKGIAIGGQGRIAVSGDTGQTWRFADDTRQASDALYDIAPIPTGGFLLVGGGGFVARGHDEAWQPATVPEGIYAWLAGAGMAAGGEGFAVGSDGILLSTRDFGKTWLMGAWEKGSTR